MRDTIPANRADGYRRWFAYEQDSHERVFASLATVPEGGRFGPAFQKALMLMRHLAAARQLWLFRFGASQKKPDDFFPAGLSLAETTNRITQVQKAWSDYFARLDQAELSRTFDESLEGGRFRNTVEDILTQLFGHSLYQRGQIASLIREAGGEPAQTDFVFWTREALP